MGSRSSAVGDIARADRLLARRAVRGDREAFDELFDDVAPRLYRFVAARMGGEPDQIRDVVQSTLCKAIGSLDSYRGEAAFFSWVCGICRFEILARYKRLGRTPKEVGLVEEVPEIRAALETLTSEADDPEEALHRREVVRLVHVALDHLPVHYGKALEWKYCEGLSVKEIARRLDLGPKAAESVLSRARVAFRDAFSALGAGVAKEEA